jgi:hypothetical protein
MAWDYPNLDEFDVARVITPRSGSSPGMNPAATGCK